MARVFSRAALLASLYIHTSVPENLLENRSRMTNPAGIPARARSRARDCSAARVESWESNGQIGAETGNAKAEIYGALRRHNSFATQQTRETIISLSFSFSLLQFLRNKFRE